METAVRLDNSETCKIHLEDCVKNLSAFISNNLHTLRIHLYIKILSKKSFDIYETNLSQDEITKQIVYSCTQIQNTLSAKHHLHEVQMIESILRTIMNSIEQDIFNTHPDIFDQISTALTDLNIFWRQKLLKNLQNNPMDLFSYYNKIAYLEYLDTKMILDVGANCGQYASRIYNAGYQHKIYSFEPVPTVYKVLENVKNNTEYSWETHPIGFSDKQSCQDIYVPKESACSSFNPHFQNKLLGDIEHSTRISVNLDTLDHYLKKHTIVPENCHLKIDVENFDKEVLLGAKETLKSVDSLEIESRFIYYSNNQWLAADIITYLNQFDLYPIQFSESITDIGVGCWFGSDMFFIKKNKLKELSWMISLQKTEDREFIKCSNPTCQMDTWL